jgi:hypothetical protein
MLSVIFSMPATALECPPFPQQVSKDSETKVKAEVGKIGPLKGGELETQVKTVTKELMSSLPSADRVYLEQMMYAGYCSGLRDNKQLSEGEKTNQLRLYNQELRGAVLLQKQSEIEKGYGSSRAAERAVAIRDAFEAVSVFGVRLDVVDCN